MKLTGGRLLLVLCLTALGACDQFGQTGLSGDNLAPVGSPDVEGSVDGLVVGHRLMAAGEYELALKNYTRAIQEQGLTVDVMSALGSANLKLGRLKQAELLLNRATELDPDFGPAWNNLGVVQMSLGNHIQAHQSFQAAFALDNGASEEVWQNLILAINILKKKNNEQIDQTEFDLVRRGNGRFLLLETP